jgi:hypothetical protein
MKNITDNDENHQCMPLFNRKQADFKRYFNWHTNCYISWTVNKIKKARERGEEKD